MNTTVFSDKHVYTVQYIHNNCKGVAEDFPKTLSIQVLTNQVPLFGDL